MLVDFVERKCRSSRAATTPSTARRPAASQRHHQVRQQQLPRQHRQLLHERQVAGRRAAGAASESGQPDPRGVHEHPARSELLVRAGRRPRRSDPVATRPGSSSGYLPQFDRTRADGDVQPEPTADADRSRRTSEDHNLNYNVTSQLRSNLRLKFSGSNERDIGGASAARQWNRTAPATRRFLSSRMPLTTNGSNNSYAGRPVVGGLAEVLCERERRDAQLQHLAGHSHRVLDAPKALVHGIEHVQSDGGARLERLPVPGYSEQSAAAQRLYGQPCRARRTFVTTSGARASTSMRPTTPTGRASTPSRLACSGNG